MMRRLLRIVATPFGLCAAGCLILAGWAMWTGGLLDGPVARQVRTSPVYAAPGTELDQAAAEQVVGNRRLVVVLLAPGADLATECGRLSRAAAGTVVLLLSPDGEGEYDRYGCSLLATDGPADLGRAVAVESIIGRGVDPFGDRPLEAVKVAVINYDLLVSAGSIPGDARTVSPSLPRYLVAAAAVLAVLVGTTVAYAAARRAGALATRRLAQREALTDRRAELAAATAALAQQIVDLDRTGGREARVLAAEFAELLDEVSADAPPERLSRRVAELSARARRAQPVNGRARPH